MIADGCPIDDKIVDDVAEDVLAYQRPFHAVEVANTFHASGVPWITPPIPGSNFWHRGSTMPCYEAANRLLQKLRKAGKIKTINNRTWVVI